MRWLVLGLGFWVSATSWAAPGSKDALLSAWESVQKQHEQVADFEKLDDRRYQLTFKTLPFSGQVRLLAWGVEPMAFQAGDTRIEKMGYVELELEGAPEGMASQYPRTYRLWQQDNTLYYEANSERWMAQSEYSQVISREYEQGGLAQDWADFLYQYGHYGLMLIVLYFFVSQIINNRRLKRSLVIQREAVDNAAQMHRQTNRLLEQMLETLSQRRGD